MIAYEWPITKKDVAGFSQDKTSEPYVDPVVGVMVLKPGFGIGLFETEESMIARGAVYTWAEAVEVAE